MTRLYFSFPFWDRFLVLQPKNASEGSAWEQKIGQCLSTDDRRAVSPFLVPRRWRAQRSGLPPGCARGLHRPLSNQDTIDFPDAAGLIARPQAGAFADRFHVGFDAVEIRIRELQRHGLVLAVDQARHESRAVELLAAIAGSEPTSLPVTIWSIRRWRSSSN